MKASKKKALNIRIFVVGCFFGFLFAIISVKAFYLHVFKGPWLSKRAATEYRISSVSNGKRGIIYDRNYHVMAVTIDGQSIAAHPKKIKNPAKNARLLASTLDMKTSTLKKRLASNRSFVWVKRRISPKETKQIQKLEIEGLDFIPEHDRHYTKRTLAAQVIGFTGTDGKGLEGLEYSYNKYLMGTQARSTFIKDALGRRLTHNEKVDDRMASAASSGNNLILTLDQTIQYISENVLEDTVKQFRAKSGIAIVMNPMTGAVLALAHYPGFNPNTFREFDNEQWRNRAITDPFEPGSTMKVFSAAAAIETKAFPNDTIFYCEKGAYKIGRNTVHDTKPHAWLTLEKIIKVSSNIGMIKVSEKTGAMALYDTFKKFGFGKRTGIDCPGETAGSLSDYTKWSDIDKGTISFGHGLSVSAIQLVTATCAIANGGILMKPYIVQAITKPTGAQVEVFGPKMVRRAVSKQTALDVKKMMRSVVEKGGTGTKANLESYIVCGKTGTAQKINRKGTYADKDYIASFVGFAPYEKPQIAVLVVVDEPVTNHYGGTVAAPAFRKIVHETLNYLNVHPEKPSKKPLYIIKKDSKEQGANG